MLPWSIRLSRSLWMSSTIVILLIMPGLFDNVSMSRRVLNNQWFPNCTELLEHMWSMYSPFAGNELRSRINRIVASQSASDWIVFHQDWWELAVGCHLIDAGVTLHPRHDPHGPDILASVGGQRVWIECTACGPGNGPNAVRDVVPNGVAHSVNQAPIDLRIIKSL